MKIIQLSKYYKPYSGGIESVVSDISENIEGDNNEVIVIATDSQKLPKHEVINGIKIIRSKELFSLFSTSISPGYIYNMFKYRCCDIIHIHLPNPLANLAVFVSFLFARKIKMPKLIIHWHSDIIKQKKSLLFYTPLLNWLLSRADKIIVTSESYLKSSEQLNGFKDKCDIIPIGINSLEDKVNDDLVLAIKEKYRNKKIIFTLGRHVYYKGFEFLLHAAPKISDETVILIGGIGPDTPKYNNLISDLNLENKVFLIGRVSDDDLASYYYAADIFCFPSIEKSEAFGVAQLEAMSLGIPVVSTNIIGSGVPWVNLNMHSGLVCPPQDSSALVETINTILHDDNLLTSLGKGAKERYVKLFSLPIMTKSINSLYHSIVNKN